MINGKELSHYEDYEKIILSYREKGEPIPKNSVLYESLSEKYGQSVQTINMSITAVRKYKKFNK